MSKRRASDQRTELFVRHFCEGKSGTEAARLAGYAAGSAHVTASRLLSKAKVRARIDAINLAATEAAGINRSRTLQEMGNVAYADIRALFQKGGNLKQITDLSAAEAAQLAGVEIETVTTQSKDGESSTSTTVKKVRVRDKVAALRLCVDVLGLAKPVDPASVVGGLRITIIPHHKWRASTEGGDE